MAKLLFLLIGIVAGVLGAVPVTVWIHGLIQKAKAFDARVKAGWDADKTEVESILKWVEPSAPATQVELKPSSPTPGA